MKLEHLLLGVLLMKPRTGYDLKRFMDLQGVFMRPRTQMSQVYRSLTTMAENGWATFTVSERPGAQDAKIYSATDLGRQVFMGWLNSPYVPAVYPFDSEIRARLYFIGFLGEDALIDLLTTEIEARERQIAKYRFRDRTIEVGEDAPFDLELTEFVEEFEHQSGSASMDLHVAQARELRDLIIRRRAESREASTPLQTQADALPAGNA
ncbi:PadR family transcriptional regulator [Microbacterium sp.]|uniref:PadR family transcriptional regulator n=1 Tax=Microbacterium sp. TaxID=51671 RepID=UPI00092BDD37|nr:PadR family transcriptional regulator [Microbacterium sp.]MBN9194261.1 PadR family transcriptional regulator [Microbacterium sp.]OJU62563.1 MAG: hypothetical protein BGO04_05915 [Microbacterium sp. 70-38]